MPFSSPGDLPDPGIEPEFPESPSLAGGFFTTEPPGEVQRKFSKKMSDTVIGSHDRGLIPKADAETMSQCGFSW